MIYDNNYNIYNFSYDVQLNQYVYRLPFRFLGSFGCFLQCLQTENMTRSLIEAGAQKSSKSSKPRLALEMLSRPQILNGEASNDIVRWYSRAAFCIFCLCFRLRLLLVSTQQDLLQCGMCEPKVEIPILSCRVRHAKVGPEPPRQPAHAKSPGNTFLP